MTASFPGGRW